MSKLSHSSEYKKSAWHNRTPEQKRARLDYQIGYRHGIRKGNQNKKPEGEAAKWAAFYLCRRSAERRGLTFAITLEDFLRLSGSSCSYCGIEWSVETCRTDKGMNGTYKRNGIDRQDSDIGYVLDNCVPCCWKCNRLKWEDSVEDLVAHAERIVAFQKFKLASRPEAVVNKA